MKPAIDPTIASAVAFLALVPHVDSRSDMETAESAAVSVLNIELCFDEDDQKTTDLIASTQAGFCLGLQIGARIGSDPAHVPEVKDLIKQYSHGFKREKAA